MLTLKGGTWLENVYPGVRCDIPSHVYQSSFAPKRDWSDQFAPGSEIRQYWQDVAKQYNVYQYARFNERVVSAQWDPTHGHWRVTSKRVDSQTDNTTKTQNYDFVLTAVGRFNDWQLPEYPGIGDFRGLLRHTSNWDPTFNPENKRVAVIGNGASGIQVVSSLQKTVSRLDHYARSKTWIASSWAGDERTLEPQPYSAETQQAFEGNDETYLSFRKNLEDKYWRRFGSFIKGSQDNTDLKDKFATAMKQKLAGKKASLLANDIVPDFSPNCRRLTPGPGYLEAIGQDNVEYIQTPIRRITATGIETQDGVHRPVDAIFCATGSKRDFLPPLSVTVGDLTLDQVWDTNGQHGFPYSYLGVAVPDFPNFLLIQGPHGTAPSGTVPQSVESQVAYVAKVLRKVSREGIKSIKPSKAAADDFVAFCDSFFKQSVVSESCSSWYNGGKPGGRVHGIWPGSAAHLTIVRREPRWEDWEYELLQENKGNRFAWYLGNGWTKMEKDEKSDMTAYLHKGDVDLRDIHESWHTIP